jgi:hypothetical protein
MSLAHWMVIASPFVLGGAILLADKLYRAFGKWHERRAIEKRNALQELYGMKPFRGTKEYDAGAHQARYP